MALVAQFVRGIQPVVDLVYPPRCPAFGVAIADQQGLCVDCWGTLEIPAGDLDEHFNVPLYAATFYNDTSRKLVLAYKHGGRIALSRLLARLIAARIPDASESPMPPLLVPVPLHRWRLWHRGFNQAALLARELAAMGKAEILADGLIRRKRTPSLSGLGRTARDKALAGAIVVNPTRSAMLAGREIVLIDDVLTSGATTLASARSARFSHRTSPWLALRGSRPARLQTVNSTSRKT